MFTNQKVLNFLLKEKNILLIILIGSIFHAMHTVYYGYFTIIWGKTEYKFS